VNCFRTRVAGILLLAGLWAASAGMFVPHDSGSTDLPACHAHPSSQTQLPTHPADHFCCIVGHNHSLPNPPVAIPVIAMVGIVPPIEGLPVTGFAGPVTNPAALSASPPLLSPLRI
jgi:hypothetical protein